MRQVAFALIAVIMVATNAAAQAQCYPFPPGVGSGQVCLSGVFPDDPIIVEMGGAVPLPNIRYVNDTDRDMTFKIEWTGVNAPPWGPRVIHQVTLAPHTEATYTDVQIQTHNLMRIGSNIVEIGWSVGSGDDKIQGSARFEVILLLPGQLREIILLPTRWCVIEGSPQAAGGEAGEFVTGRELLALLQRVNDEIWVPNARIFFRSGLAPGIPVIADPEPQTLPNTSEQVGDVDESLMIEAKLVQMACERAWADLDPDQRGIILVNVRRFVDQNGQVTDTRGVAPYLAPSLYVEGGKFGSGKRGDDLCGHPRNLRVSDVTPEYVAVIDPTFEDDPKFLAHELGHALLLGHGNGLDDNQDGLEPPEPGPRRYDEYCDPLWLVPPRNEKVAEDQLTEFRTCEESSSLMKNALNESDCSKLRPLQVEAARAAAKLVPGAAFDRAADPAGAIVAGLRCSRPPCGLPPDIFLTKAEMSTTPDSETTSFSLTVLGPIPLNVNNHYLVFADLDNNPATGCAPTALGFPTDFQGAELVTRVEVEQVDEVQEVTPALWQCQSGTLVPVSDPRVRGTAYTQMDEMQLRSLFGIISIHIPDAVRGPAASTVRIQALAQQLESGGQFDRLPITPDGGGVISLLPPPLPQCSLTPPVVNPGGTTTIAASGLLANQTAEAYLGDQMIATGSIDSDGVTHLDVIIPSSSRQGVRPVSIVVEGTTVNAACAILVDGPPLTPATAAVLTPRPNEARWNNSDVTVTLTATRIPGGAEIKEITFSANGAQTIPSTTVAGASTEITIEAEGQTKITFFATDNLSNRETPQSITVKVDKTPPNIIGSITPPPNGFDWNTNVTVNFTCADAISGVIFCSGPTTLTMERANQGVTGTATDFAGNSTSTLISNVSENGGFEDFVEGLGVAVGWDRFASHNVSAGWYDDTWTKVVFEGRHAQLLELIHALEPDRYAGIFQTIDVVPGTEYVLTIHGLVRSDEGSEEASNFGYFMQYGINYQGGIDWQSPDIEWVVFPWGEQPREDPTSQNVYQIKAFTATIRTQANKLTLFIRGQKRWPGPGEGNYDIDGVSLIGPFNN